MPTVSSEERVAFVADARLISVLGEQLIGSEKVGILELVKNAYDAGASSCVVTLEGVRGLSPDRRTLFEYASLPGPVIEIRDDGSGMNRDDLVNGWLRPATSRRARVKERLRTEREAARAGGSLSEYNALVARLKEAHGGRLPLGEKGIGRLATHRLGRMLWLRTKTSKDPLEWELRIDWDRFDSLEDSQVDLSAIPLTLRHHAPTADYGARGSGTVICCHGGRLGYSWTLEGIIDVGRAINALRSPHRAPSDFAPRFETPHVPESAVASPLERVPAPFELLAIVDDNGTADLDLTFTPPASLSVDVSPFRREERKDLRTRYQREWRRNGRALLQPTCGPFLVHVRAWIRMREWMGPDYKELSEYLDQFGGLTVYRDGLAALPAQQTAKGDWLGLAMAQSKKTSNISYYHLSGEIEIAQERTLDLRDRSSREGMIETRPYRDLVFLTKAIVDELQFHMQEARDQWSRRQGVGRIALATTRADARLAADIGRALADHYDFQNDPLHIAKISGGRHAVEHLTETSDRLRSLGEQLKLQEEERNGLLEAAGFGLAIGVAVHEIGKLASAISADARQLRGAWTGEPGSDEVCLAVERRAEALMAEVKRLAPLRVTRSEASRRFSIRSTIEAARSAFLYSMEQSHVLSHVDGDDFLVYARFGTIAQVFANLFDNALYWIATAGGGGAIQIVVSKKNRTVLFADSGPGVSEKMKPHLFEPFYSEKSPPSGLGLYVCRHYLGQTRASIRLARNAERMKLPGAQLLMDFSQSREGEQLA